MRTATCPYCDEENEICHDYGYGLDDAKTYEQECGNCENNFAYTTHIDYWYLTRLAPCLNGGEHDYNDPWAHWSKTPRTVCCNACGKEHQHNRLIWQLWFSGFHVSLEAVSRTSSVERTAVFDWLHRKERDDHSPAPDWLEQFKVEPA